MRSLLLATAGHVNHGKSTLIERLTGKNPDRLPQEKLRGMTLDLGFGHTEGISFVDCPGHESLTKHTIAGHSGVDGALLVVAWTEGVREQTREHARVLEWLGVHRVLAIITKSDLASNDAEKDLRFRKISGEVRGLFSPRTQLDFVLSPHLDAVSPLREKIDRFFTPVAKTKTFSYNRFAVDRAFSLKGFGTIVAGTLTEGPIKKGDKCVGWLSNGKKQKSITIRNLRQVTNVIDDAREPGRYALCIDGAHPDEFTRGSQLLFGPVPDLASNLALNLDWVVPVKKQFSALLQWGTLSHEVVLNFHPKGFWRCRPEFPLPLRRGDRVIIRSPHRVAHLGQSIGGGFVIDAYLPQGRLLSAPPDLDDEFLAWHFKTSVARVPTTDEISVIGGITTLQAEKIRKTWPGPPEIEKPRLNAQPGADGVLAPGQEKLLTLIDNEKWAAYVDKSDLTQAHILARLKRLHHIRDTHFLHERHYDALVAWLNSYFSTNEALTIDNARDFFQTGRKTFLEILEFCDRHQFTFRKDNVRKKFKLPPCSHPNVRPR